MLVMISATGEQEEVKTLAQLFRDFDTAEARCNTARDALQGNWSREHLTEFSDAHQAFDAAFYALMKALDE